MQQYSAPQSAAMGSPAPLRRDYSSILYPELTLGATQYHSFQELRKDIDLLRNNENVSVVFANTDSRSIIDVSSTKYS